MLRKKICQIIGFNYPEDLSIEKLKDILKS
jgi:hypothetical protein